ncbi:hypothetical protein E4U53_003156 [Claviceps sorghi]|nr:hypothetical protein E4U53_003156 [Claviceps sorghi]
MRLTSVVTLLAGFMSSISAAPAAEEVHSLDRRLSSQGFKDGYFYSLWADYGGVSYDNRRKGEFAVKWNKGGNFLAGKGRKPGTTSPIKYKGNWKCDGNCYLAVYGWCKLPLIEFYVVENYGNYNPGASCKKQGEFTVDGSIYDIYVGTRVNAPSIAGTATFKQYWSIRRNKRFQGTVTIAEHIKAWKAHGMPLGALDEVILAVEGYQSSGSASFVVQ